MERDRKRKLWKITAAVSAGILVILAAVLLIRKYMPTGQKMSGYDYFKTDSAAENDSTLVILDNEILYDKGRYIDGRLYLQQSFVQDNVNMRFYYDKESNAVLYSDWSAVYTYYPDVKGYRDQNGNTYDTEYEVIKMADDVIYIDFEYMAAVSNISYEYAKEPQRLVLHTTHEEQNEVTIRKNTVVRYRAGIKSKVLEKVKKGTVCQYVGAVDDDWIEVITPSGYQGYVKKNAASDVYTAVPEDTYTEEYQSNLCGYKVNMTWFQVTQRAANAYIDTYLEDVSGINTISPTWYSIADGTGELTSLASDTFVSNMHARGLKVWPLVNDFNNNVDYAAFYSSKTARTKLINNLMQEARQYGYDGYNIDFEYVKKDFADDYLQFLRELSIACQNNGLVLSVDNYKPANHNAHYELAEQAVFVDYIVIMGYDEHYAGSDAGSVASLPFVEDGISRAVSMVPSEQVINAVPFYTRIWTENAGETKSRAVGMKAAMDAMQENGATAEWDETTGQYYCTYETSAGTVQIWFEEDRSIGEKMKLYSKYKLGGVAEWKLGLETSSVWSIISNGLNYAS